jgi:hypothetical protein
MSRPWRARNFGQSARLSVDGRAKPERDRPPIRALPDLDPSLRPAKTVPSSLFQLLLCAEFPILPEPVQRPHGLTTDAVTGLRAPGRDVPVMVAFRLGREFWRRRFVGGRYQSGFAAALGRRAGLPVEGFFHLSSFTG